MKLDAKQLAQALVEATASASDREMKTVVRDFVKFLGEQKALGMWRDIERNIHRAWKEKFGASKVKIVSAHALSAEARTTLEKIASGAEIEQIVNDKLIAGAVIRVDDRRIDGSILGNLQRLKRELTT